MRRLSSALFIGSTLALAVLVIWRVATKKETAPSQEHIALATYILESFSKVATQPLDVALFKEIVEHQIVSDLNNLTADEQRKLLACVAQF